MSKKERYSDSGKQYEFVETNMFSIDALVCYLKNKNGNIFNKKSEYKNMFYGDLFPEGKGCLNGVQIAKFREGWIRIAASEFLINENKKFKMKLGKSLTSEYTRIRQEWKSAVPDVELEDAYSMCFRDFFLKRNYIFSFAKHTQNKEESKIKYKKKKQPVKVERFDDLFEIREGIHEESNNLVIKKEKMYDLNTLDKYNNQYKEKKDFFDTENFSDLELLKLLYSYNEQESDKYEDIIEILNELTSSKELDPDHINKLRKLETIIETGIVVLSDEEIAREKSAVYFSTGNYFDIFSDMVDSDSASEYVYKIIEVRDEINGKIISEPTYKELSVFIKGEDDRFVDLEKSNWYIQVVNEKEKTCAVILNGQCGIDENIIKPKNISEWQKKYEENEKNANNYNPELAILFSASCYSKSEARGNIGIIMNRHSLNEGEALVLEFKSLFEQHKYKAASDLISELEKCEFLPDYYYYLYAKLIEYGFVKGKNIDAYCKCLEINEDEITLFKKLAAVKLLYDEVKKEKVDNKKINRLKNIAETDEKLSEYYEFLGDYYSSYAGKIKNNDDIIDFGSAIKNYIIADSETAYNKANLLIEKLYTEKKATKLLTEIKENINKITDSNYILKSGLLYKENFSNEYYNKAQKIIDDIQDIDNIDSFEHLLEKYNPMNAKETFVVLGVGDASQAFLSSIIDREDVQVFVLCWQLTEEKKEWIRKFYPNVEPIEYHGFELNQILDLYNLESADVDLENVTKEVELNRKIHFVALSEDKTENLSFAIKVIEDTYVKQLVYNSIYKGLVSLKKYIDLVLAVSNENMRLYIDSLMCKFPKFYIPIKNIDYGNEISKQLLLENPLFISLNEEETENGIKIPNIVILGNDETVISTIKNIVSVIKYSSFDETGDSIPEITIVNDNAFTIKSHLLFDCPNLLESPFVNYFDMKFYERDVFGYDFINAVDRTCEEMADDELAIRLRRATYFICATSVDNKNVILANKLREVTIAGDYEFKYRPQIAVLCRNRVFAKKLSEIKVQKTFRSDAWYASYDLNPYGIFYDCYSYDRIYNSFITLYAKEINGQFYSNKDDANKVYYNLEYNRDSSEMAAVSMIYRMFAAGVFEQCDLQNWKFYDFVKRIKEYRAKFENIINPSQEFQELMLNGSASGDIVEELSKLEHIRWCCHEISRGYRKADRGQVESYIQRGVPTHQLYISRLHPYIVDWSELGEKSISDEDKVAIKESLKKAKASMSTKLNDIMPLALNYMDETLALLCKQLGKEYDRVGNITGPSSIIYKKYCELFDNYEKNCDDAIAIYDKKIEEYKAKSINENEIYKIESFKDNQEKDVNIYFKILHLQFNKRLYLLLTKYYNVVNNQDISLMYNVSLNEVQKNIMWCNDITRILNVCKKMHDKVIKSRVDNIERFNDYYISILYKNVLSKKVMEEINKINIYALKIAELSDEDQMKKGDKLQGWLDDLFDTYGLKEPGAIRDGNREMIRDTVVAIDNYIAKYVDNVIDERGLL